MTIPPFDILGWDLEEEGSQLVGECPFCGKDKMYVDPRKTTYHCKVCDSKGNSVSVLGEMFDRIYKPAFKGLHAKTLSKRRGLPIEAFTQDKNIGWDKHSDCPVFLIRRCDGTPVTLRRAHYLKRKYVIRNMKGTSLGLLGAEHMADNEHPIYIVEGEWDRAALMYALTEAESPAIVLSVPGAGNFKEDWVPQFKGRDITIVFDNDNPGIAGCRKVALRLKNHAKVLKFMTWPKDIDEGLDIHDLVVENVQSPGSVVEFIDDNSDTKIVVDGEEEDIGVDNESEQLAQEAMEVLDVDGLHAVFHKWLKLENCDLLDITYGCLWSIFLGGDPLWMMVVSPPSGSKSESLGPVSAWYKVHPISTLTAKSLISGFHGQGGSDPSLFAEMEGKRQVLIIKDLTPLLSGNPQERDEVFGILRDAYDGNCTKQFGNGVKRVYKDLNFSVITGVTPAIDSYGSVAMGERFLKFRADKELSRHDDYERALKAVMNSTEPELMREEMRVACLRCLAKKPPEAGDVPMPEGEFVEFVADLAVFTARCRGVAPTDRYSGLQDMTPVVEAPPRLVKQFVKLAQGLAYHYGADTLCDKRVMNLVRRVALHTPDIITMRVITVLHEKQPEGGCSIKTIYHVLKILGMETIKVVVDKLTRIGLCEKLTTLEGSSKYQLDQKIFDMIEKRQLFSNLPKNDPLYRTRKLRLRRMTGTPSISSGTSSESVTESTTKKKPRDSMGRGQRMQFSESLSLRMSSES